MPIIAPPPQSISRPADFLRACFRTKPAQLARVEAAAKNSGLVIVRKRPVVFREGDPPLVALFGLMRAEDLPEWFRGQTWTEPDLIIRTRDGKIHPGIFRRETGHRLSAVNVSAGNKLKPAGLVAV